MCSNVNVALAHPRDRYVQLPGKKRRQKKKLIRCNDTDSCCRSSYEITFVLVSQLTENCITRTYTCSLTWQFLLSLIDRNNDWTNLPITDSRMVDCQHNPLFLLKMKLCDGSCTIVTFKLVNLSRKMNDYDNGIQRTETRQHIGQKTSGSRKYPCLILTTWRTN